METLNECSLPNSQARLCDKQLLNAGQSGLCYSQVTTPVAKRPVRRPCAAAVIVQSTRVSGDNSEMATTPSLFDNLIPSLPMLVNDLTSNSLLVHRSTTEELQITDNHLPRWAKSNPRHVNCFHQVVIGVSSVFDASVLAPYSPRCYRHFLYLNHSLSLELMVNWLHLRTADPLRLNCAHGFSSFSFWQGNPTERCFCSPLWKEPLKRTSSLRSFEHVPRGSLFS